MDLQQERDVEERRVAKGRLRIAREGNDREKRERKIFLKVLIE